MSVMAKLTYRKKAYLDLIAVAAIWGAAGSVAKFTLSEISPFSFLAYRFAIMGLFAVIYIAIKGIKIPKKKKNLLPVATYGLLAFTLALSLLFLGLDNSTVLDLTLIGLAGPLLVTMGGVWFFHDRITHREKIGISIAVFGVIINSLFPLINSTSSLRLTGNIILIMYLLSDTSSVLYSKKLVRAKIPPISIAMVGFIVAAVTLIPLALIIDGPGKVFSQIANLSPSHHLGVWYMAFLSGILAYFLAVKGGKSIEISEAWLFMYLQPIFAIPLAVFWLGESLTASFIVGAAIIMIGIYIAEKKVRKKRVNHS